MGDDLDPVSGSSDPLSVLAQEAVTLHEVFTSLVAAGFTEGQALYLLGQRFSESRPPT